MQIENMLSDSRGGSEIVRRSGDGKDLSVGNKFVVNIKIILAFYLEFLRVYLTAETANTPIGMVGKIYESILIGNSSESDFNAAVVIETIDNRCIQIAWITFFSVRGMALPLGPTKPVQPRTLRTMNQESSLMTIFTST